MTSDPAGHAACPTCGTPLAPPTGPMHTLVLPYTAPPLNANHRRGHYAHAAIVRQLRQDAWVLAKKARIGGPHPRVVVVLHWRPGRRGRYDSENPYPTLKACADGLTDAHIVDDDTAEQMDKQVRIHPPERGKPGALWLTVQVPG